MSAEFFIGFAYLVGAMGLYGMALQGFSARKKLRLKQQALKEDKV